jgi:hypothetical protein
MLDLTKAISYTMMDAVGREPVDRLNLRPQVLNHIAAHLVPRQAFHLPVPHPVRPHPRLAGP